MRVDGVGLPEGVLLLVRFYHNYPSDSNASQGLVSVESNLARIALQVSREINL
jgi:hypothetical protein